MCVLCHSHPAKTNRGLSYSQCTVANAAPQHWLPTQTNQWKSSRWVVVFEALRSLSVLCLLSVRWPVQISKYTIWVMVGIQGRVVAIDFSAFTVHCSKLRPDGRSVSFYSFYLLERIKDYSSCVCPLTRCVSLVFFSLPFVFFFFSWHVSQPFFSSRNLFGW